MQHVLRRENRNKQDWIPGVLLKEQFIFTGWADEISFPFPFFFIDQQMIKAVLTNRVGLLSFESLDMRWRVKFMGKNRILVNT